MAFKARFVAGLAWRVLLLVATSLVATPAYSQSSGEFVSRATSVSESRSPTRVRWNEYVAATIQPCRKSRRTSASPSRAG